VRAGGLCSIPERQGQLRPLAVSVPGTPPPVRGAKRPRRRPHGSGVATSPTIRRPSVRCAPKRWVVERARGRC